MADNEQEQMRQMLFNVMARLSATESISRAAFAMMCSFDGSPEMKDKLANGIFPMLLEQAKTREWPAPPELAAWLRNQEAAVLTGEFQNILAEIDAVRNTSKRKIN